MSKENAVTSNSIEVSDGELEDFVVGGEPLTEDRASKIAADALEARRRNLTPGGTSLSGNGKHSPVVQVRLPETARDELVARAGAAGVSVSKYARELLIRALG